MLPQTEAQQLWRRAAPPAARCLDSSVVVAPAGSALRRPLPRAGWTDATDAVPPGVALHGGTAYLLGFAGALPRGIPSQLDVKQQRGSVAGLGQVAFRATRKAAPGGAPRPESKGMSAQRLLDGPKGPRQAPPTRRGCEARRCGALRGAKHSSLPISRPRPPHPFPPPCPRRLATPRVD